MQLNTIVGFVAGILTAIAMLPQLIKTVKEKKSRKYFSFNAGSFNGRCILMDSLWIFK